MCMKFFYFRINSFNQSGFVANVKWREEPRIGMLHHKLRWFGTLKFYLPFFLYLNMLIKPLTVLIILIPTNIHLTRHNKKL